MKMSIRRSAAAAAVALSISGLGVLAGPHAAGAASVFDGTWTVSHGGEGQLVLDADGTYTATCSVRDGYAATCPDSSGTFARGYGGASSYVFFYGDAGHTVSFRWAGEAGEPSSMASGGLSGMIIDRGSEFVCSEFWENGYQLAKTPMVYVGANGNIFGVGSNQDLGPRDADNWVNLAETGPNYFVEGDCSGAGGGGGSTTSTVVHVADSNGRAVAGATVQGTWSGGTTVSCVTGANGSCTVNSPGYRNGLLSTELTVNGVSATGTTYDSVANTDPTAVATARRSSSLARSAERFALN